MVVSGPHFPRHDPEAAWKALVSYGLEAQARHMAQIIGQIHQVMGALSQPDVDRLTGLRLIRTWAQMVARDAEGLVALSHLAESMILSQPLLSSPPATGEEAGRTAPVEAASDAEPTPKADGPEIPALQEWRDASDVALINYLKAWMEKANISQDDLCRALDYKPVYVRRVMRGTDPVTGRFRQRLLDYVASLENRTPA